MSRFPYVAAVLTGAFAVLFGVATAFAPSAAVIWTFVVALLLYAFVVVSAWVCDGC